MVNHSALVLTRANLEAGAHHIWRNGRHVPDGHWGAWVGWLAALLAVGVAQIATNGLGVANLAAGVKEVLALQNLVWGELTQLGLSAVLATNKVGRSHKLGSLGAT